MGGVSPTISPFSTKLEANTNIMTSLYTTLDRCLMCASTDMRLRVPLRPIPIATPNFTVTDQLKSDGEVLEAVPLELFQCGQCGHVQVGHVGNPELQYRNYVYTTSLSPGLTEHFERHAAATIERIGPKPGALVAELGSNDGTLLRFFQRAGLRVVGVDPAKRIADAATAAGIETLAEFFTEELAQTIVARNGKATIVIANNMIANVHDLRDFAEGVRTLLAPDGVFIFETQYCADVVERVLLDTVYHEHLSYFLVTPTVLHMRRHGMEVIDVERVPTKGGSLRVTVQPSGGPRATSPRVSAMMDRETKLEMFDTPFFRMLGDRIAAIRKKLGAIVADAQARGREVAGYGVSVGTTALLPQFDLSNKIAFLVDDDPEKEAALLGPDYSIPVVSPEELASRIPAAVIVFAWRYADAIIARRSEYLRAGGTFVIPLPDVTVRELA